MQRLRVCGVLLLVAGTMATGSAAARPASRADRAVVAAVQRLRTAIAHTGHHVLAAKARRRDLRLAGAAARAFGRRAWCRGTLLVARVDRVRTTRRALAAVEKAVARSGRAKQCQRVPRAATSVGHESTGGGYPAAPYPPPGADENDQGEDLPPLPQGPFRPGAKQDAPSDAGDSAAARGPVATAAAVTDPVDAFTKTDLGDSGWTGSVQDPSEASAGNVVLVSVNRALAWSKDGGKTFTYLDPTTLWPSVDGGICCDQVLQYDKTTNRFFWLLQYNCSPGCDGSSTSENRYRLALATPAQVVSSNATGWKYFDFTSKTFDEAKQWMDYPDMALGSKSLYFTFDLPRKGSAIWVRIKKSDLVNLGSIGFRYLVEDGHYVLKTVQRTGTRGWIAERKDASDFYLSHWDDSSIYVYTDTVGFPTPPTENCSEAGPDGVNMLKMFDCAGFSQRIGGAARQSNGKIWVAWTAGRRVAGAGSNLFPHAHIQLLTIDPGSMSVVRNRSIWNANYMWAYPALSASGGGEVAMTYFTGGGTAGYFNWGVGFVTNTESFRRVATGAFDRERIGDYLTVRPAWNSTKLYSATGYILDSSNRFHPYWALFGRTGDKPIVFTPPVTPPINPNPPPPPTPATSTLTLSCPASPVPFGQQFTVTGHLDPAQTGATISITYSRPQLGDTTHTTATDSGGNFSNSTATARQSRGTWTVSASYAGDATHTSAQASCTQTVS